jgi:hypothetical protein
MRFALIGLLVIITITSYSPAFAAGNRQDCPATVTWSELLTPAFALLFSEDEPDLGQAVWQVVERDLQNDMPRFTTLFGSPLHTPIAIRIYPDETYYYCLNPLAPEIQSNYHAHLGLKEIALIGERIDRDDPNWQRQLLNALRFELASLFVEKVTDGRVPPGLLASIGEYAKDPQESVGLWLEAQRIEDGEVAETPERSWRGLIEDPDLASDRAGLLQGVSLVAYLAEVYGWPKFQAMLHAIPRQEGYRQALVETYGIELADLERQWHLYYPLFVQGRWRTNVIYGFDLSVFERLLEKGAYADAAEGLKEAIVFLESLRETRKIRQAEALLEIAQLGQEAGALARQSRQALQNKEYALSIELAGQAEAIYLQLGDTRRMAELDEFRNWAVEVLALKAEFREIESGMDADAGPEAMPRLIQVSQRLFELGEEGETRQVERILGERQRRAEQRTQKTLMNGFYLIIGLLVLRLVMARSRPPQEARLL